MLVNIVTSHVRMISMLLLNTQFVFTKPLIIIYTSTKQNFFLGYFQPLLVLKTSTVN